VPFRREGPDDLIQDGNGELGEFAAAGTVFAEDFAGEGEEGVDTIQRGLFVAILRGEGLGGDAGEQFDVEVPSCGPIGVVGGEITFQEAQLELQAAETPTLEKVGSFHREGRSFPISTFRAQTFRQSGFGF